MFVVGLLEHLINIFQLSSLPAWDGCSLLSLFDALGEHLYSFTGVCLSFYNALVSVDPLADSAAQN